MQFKHLATFVHSLSVIIAICHCLQLSIVNNDENKSSYHPRLKLSSKCGSYGQQLNQTLSISIVDDQIYQIFLDFTVLTYDHIDSRFNVEKDRLDLSNAVKRQTLRQLNYNRWNLFQDVPISRLINYTMNFTITDYHISFGFGVYHDTKLGRTLACYLRRSVAEYSYELYTFDAPIQQISIRRSYSSPRQWIMINGLASIHLITYDSSKIDRFEFYSNPIERTPRASVCIDYDQNDHTIIQLVANNSKFECANMNLTRKILSSIDYGFVYAKNSKVYLVSLQSNQIYSVPYQLILKIIDHRPNTVKKQSSILSSNRLSNKSLNEFFIDCSDLVDVLTDDVINDNTTLINEPADHNTFRPIFINQRSKIIRELFAPRNRYGLIFIILSIVAIVVALLLLILFAIYEFYYRPNKSIPPRVPKHYPQRQLSEEIHSPSPAVTKSIKSIKSLKYITNTAKSSIKSPQSMTPTSSPSSDTSKCLPSNDQKPLVKSLEASSTSSMKTTTPTTTLTISQKTIKSN